MQRDWATAEAKERRALRIAPVRITLLQRWRKYRLTGRLVDGMSAETSESGNEGNFHAPFPDHARQRVFSRF